MGSWGYRCVWLCHGGAPLKSMHVLGGDDGRKELVQALDFADRMIEKHAGTPWEVLVRRAALAIYVPGGD